MRVVTPSFGNTTGNRVKAPKPFEIWQKYHVGEPSLYATHEGTLEEAKDELARLQTQFPHHLFYLK